MELKLSENIRLKRRERGISQEQLAEMLGVAPQTVSHWECGDTYPDMTLLPILAGFFGTTTDELLGVSGVLANERRQRYWDEKDSISDNDERIAHFRRAWTEFPDEWHFALHLCYAMQSGEKYIGEIRRIAYEAMEKCTDPDLRGCFVFLMAEVETDDKIDEFLSRYTSKMDLRHESMLEQRYFMRGEHDKLLVMRQRNRVEDMRLLLGSSIDEKIDDCAPSKTLHRVKTNLYYLNEYLGIDRETYMSHPVSGDGVVDLWFETRMSLGFKLACRLAMTGQTDEALDILEESTELYEKFFSLPDGTRIGYRLDGLGLLDVTVEPYVMHDEEWCGTVYDNIMSVGIKYVNRTGVVPFYDAGDVDEHIYANLIYGDLVVYGDYKWFDPIREHPRFIACKERMEKIAFGKTEE